MLRKFFKYYFTALTGIFLFTACNKEVSDGNNFVLYNNDVRNDTTWATGSFASTGIQRMLDSTAVYKHNDTMMGTNAKTIAFSEKFSVYFPANAFVSKTGDSIKGLVEIKLLLLDEKGEFIRTVKSSENPSHMLESDLAFCLIATSNGEELKIAPGKKYRIRAGNKYEQVKQQMKIYSGEESVTYTSQVLADPQFFWKEANPLNVQQSVYKTNNGSRDIEHYEIYTNQLRWMAIATPNNNLGNTNKLHVLLPPNFTNKNTIVFVTADDYNTVIQLLPEMSSRSFKSDMIPQQKKIHIITLSLIGNQFYYSETGYNYLNNKTYVSIKPEKKSLAAILNSLKKL